MIAYPESEDESLASSDRFTLPRSSDTAGQATLRNGPRLGLDDPGCDTCVEMGSDPGLDRDQLVPEERRRLILELLRERRSITVGAVELQFGVSPMTARRDLAILVREGHARRTHGGAVLPDLAAHEDSFRHRLELDIEDKERLARAVVATLEPSETLFVDSSTTGFYVARAILEAGVAVTVLTSSLPVISLVGNADARNVDLIALGGTFRRLTHSFVGPDTVRALRGYLVDRVVFSVKGVTREGFLTDADPLEAEVKRAMIAHAQTAVLLATPQKFEDRGLAVVGPVGDVDVAYITEPSPEALRMLESHGVSAHRA
jgi:DeoR/GlpR family transcriptional regulator of sugar metabolism